MQLEPNILFHDRYRLIEMKGRGSFGEVWLAQDEQLGMEVAIKVYIALDDRGVAEFKSEYKTTFGLNHPNLLHANHFDQCEKRPYLVMPYCPDAATNYIGNIDEAMLWHFIHDVASGLQYLHSMGIVHHDIKPDNILIDAEGNFLITDFGISKKIRSTLRRNSMRQMEENDLAGGSISYMGPEMFGPHAESVNATDIWALGATLYEMSEGELPFFGQGGGMQVNGAQVPELLGNYSDDFKQIVQMCLAKDPWDRPQASQLRDYAQAKMNGETPADFGIAPPPQQPFVSSNQSYGNSGAVYVSSGGPDVGQEVATKKKPKVVGWIVGIAAVAAIAIVLALMLQPRESPEQQQARENIPTYLAKVESCQSLINAGSYQNYFPLLTARDDMEAIRQLENAGRGFYPETYNRYGTLKSQLDKKMGDIAEQYGNHAKGFIELDPNMAKEEYGIAKLLNPSYTSPEYERLMNH